jgi:cation:H+ antiporter
MNLVWALVFLLVGFILLIKGADWFVDGASSIAKYFHVPSLFIGLTIVAFGTSAPEAAVSIQASLQGKNDIVLGNVIGSNILNIALIIGITALIMPLQVKQSTIRKEIPFTFLTSVLMLVLLMDRKLQDASYDMISRADGMVILLFFVIFIYYLVQMAFSGNGNKEEEVGGIPLKKAGIYLVIGIVGIIIGSRWVVNGAIAIAEGRLSERFISLTIVAFGTSLPELVTSVTAALKKQDDIAIGNIVGSNIFNICFVLGTSALITPIIPQQPILFDTVVMVLITLCLFIFSKTEKVVCRKEGFALLSLLVIYYGFIIVKL